MAGSDLSITFVAPRSWPSIGGAEAFLRHLSGALSERHQVRVLALSIGNEPARRGWERAAQEPFEPFFDGTVRIEQLRLPPLRRASLAPLATDVIPGLRRYAFGRTRLLHAELYARTVAPLIAEAAAGSDIVHTWGIGLLGAAGIRAARLLGTPAPITPFAHREQWGTDLASARTYRQADRVVALLQCEADMYAELGAPGAEVCGVCSPGVVGGGGEALRRRLGIDGPLVLFLGVRRPYKGFELLRAAADEVAGATFAFVGPGPSVEGERIVDAGTVSDDERADWLDAADLLCLPSAAEIFPSSILEAWSVGTPVLTSDIPALRELAETTGGSVAVAREVPTLAAKLRELTSSPDELRRMGLTGRDAWERHFTPTRVAALHERLYATLLGKGAANDA